LWIVRAHSERLSNLAKEGWKTKAKGQERVQESNANHTGAIMTQAIAITIKMK